MNGYLEKAWYGLPILLLGWFEVRVRGKVGEKRFEDFKEYVKEFRTETKEQLDRIEKHLNGT